MISISNSSGVDNTASRIICRFEDYSIPLDFNYVSRLVLCSGANPSYAILGNPLREVPSTTGTEGWDQTYGATDNRGPAGFIKPFSKGTVGLLTASNKFYPLFHGRVAYTSFLLGQMDCTMPCLFDGRWDLDKLTCGGRILSDGSATWWDASELIYNRFGFGDCIEVGGVPLHSQGNRFGHTDSEDSDSSTDPEPGYATSQSRKWRCSDILANLRFRFQSKGRPSFYQDIGLQDIPSDIVWPADLGSNIKENRTPRDLNLHGKSLLRALQDVVRTAGPYDITLVALPNGKSELRVIDFAPKKQSGTVFYDSTYANFNLDTASKSENLIVGGFIKESVVNCYPGGVALMGDKYATELMASTDSSGTGALYLKKGWTPEEEASWKAKIASYGEDQYAFDFANKSHPAPFNFYKLNPAKNPFAGTKHSDAPQTGSLTIKAHQLTGYKVNNNPAGITPREIVIEAKRTQREYDALSDDSDAPDSKARLGWWFYVGRYSELQLDPSRTMVRIDAIREQKKTWALVWPDEEYPDSEYDTTYLVAREIRIQLVAESNHCLVARLGGSGADSDDPNKISARLAKNHPKHTSNMWFGPLQYVDWTRSSRSRPIGEATIPSSMLAKFPAKQTQNNELFTDLVGDGDLDNPKNRMLKHAYVDLQNYKRIEYSGQFELQGLYAGYLPGQQCSYENGAPIGDISGIIKCVVLDCNSPQRTTIEWGPSEFSAIYDSVQPIQGSGVVTLSSPQPEQKKKETYDEPKTPKTPDDSYNDPQTPKQTYDSGSSSSSTSTSSGSITSDNDSEANNSAILNNPTAGLDPNSATMAGPQGGGGGGGNAGMGPSDDLAADIAAEAGPSQSKGKVYEDMGPNKAAGPSQKKGTIRTADQLAQMDADAKNFGTTGETDNSGHGRAAKGIYSGDSLKNLDNSREKATFEEGGIRDQFREGAGKQAVSGAPAAKSELDAAFGKADKNGIRTANVARGGFNPNNAAPKSNNNRGEPIKPTMSLDDAKRRYAASQGINAAQFDANRASAKKGRERK